ncbi:rhomboid family protein [Staphylococcus pasteuri]|uniref:rhomboid family protein n=1 Tax=Staphylococcus pasteuri TaxID=45972 RepID=UPI000E36F4CF|nr:rhomboid family intramembrane serine protease [Staphylococcus pasteuri]RFD70930.1 rhomboid family intramembrane serine protease [Staphylococcus pasteuri]
MNIKKQFWKTIYYWIRYLNYDVINREKDDQEIWLSNKRKKTIVIFSNHITTTQEIRFDKSRVIENKENIEQLAGFQPQTILFYYFTDKSLSTESLDETYPQKIKFRRISDERELELAMPNVILSKMINREDSKKTSIFYRNKVLSSNLLDKQMQRFSPVTYSLIIINIVLWLCMILYFNRFSDVKLLDVGGLVHFNVVHGEWYRLVTSMFLHFNFEHILMNMLSLFIFGKIVESVLGSWRMLVIYLFAGIFGNFVSLSFNTTTISVGASGAIFGLIGSIFAILYLSKSFDKKVIGQLLIALVILIGLSIFMSNINVMAHLGGFIGGLLITLIGYYFTVKRNIFWILLIILLVLFVAMQIRIFSIKEDNIYDKLIRDQMLSGNYDEARKIVNKSIKKDYADDQTYYLSGLITAAKSSKAEAMAEWERGLRLFPNSGALNYEMAIANRSLKDKSKALKYIKKARKANPQNAQYKNLEKELSEKSDS